MKGIGAIREVGIFLLLFFRPRAPIALIPFEIEAVLREVYDIIRIRREGDGQLFRIAWENGVIQAERCHIGMRPIKIELLFIELYLANVNIRLMQIG